MAFKMSKAQIAERDSMIKTTADKLEILNAKIEEFNTVIADAWGEVEDALNDYHGALADTRSFVEGLKDEFQSQYDDKSEKWQEGDRGTAAREWIDSFDNIELEEADIDEPESLSEVTCEGLDALEQMDTEAAS